METSAILTNIRQHIQLSEEEKKHLTSALLPMHVKQGDFLEKSGDFTKYLIHVNSGCLMTYYTDKKGNNHVIQFSTESWWTGDLHSLTHEVPSIFYTRALTESNVLLLTKGELEPLLEKIPQLERYFRIIFQNSLVAHQHRLIQNFSASAKERYINFRQKYPVLEQYVPLKYIASYLGITPEFLSKIRRKLME